MKSRTPFLSSLAVMGLIAGSASSATDTAGEIALLDGILARSEAIISGRITYRVTNTNGFDGTFVFTFSGTSWRVDEPAMQIERINHRGDFVEVHRTPQPNGTVRNSASFTTERSLEDRRPFPPYFGGSLWYRSTVDYIRRHSKEVKAAGTAEANGFTCAILDWTVPAEDRFKAFDTIYPPLERGGVLRLYVLEKLGYVLPRADYVSPNGELAVRYECSDFRDVGTGIFFPMKIGMHAFPGKGKRGYGLEYEIKSVEKINDPIPDEAFVVSLPEGTYVSDERRIPPLSFAVGSLPGEIGKIARFEATESTKRRWNVAIRLGVISGLNLLLITVAVYWICKKRRSTP
jgi:hypothetical protein